jgi:hypothetical protein
VRLGAFVDSDDQLKDVVGKNIPEEIVGIDYSNEIGVCRLTGPGKVSPSELCLQ